MGPENADWFAGHPCKTRHVLFTTLCILSSGFIYVSYLHQWWGHRKSLGNFVDSIVIYKFLCVFYVGGKWFCQGLKPVVLISRSLFSWTTASRKMGLAEGDIFYCILCTLDVSLLYTNIPTEDGIHACYASGHRKLEEQGPFVSSNQLAKKILELLPPQGHASATGQYQLQMAIQMVVWIPKVTGVEQQYERTVSSLWVCGNSKK